MKKLYFAFGSNMLTERIEQRVGSVVCLGAMGVMGWKLVFNAGSENKCFANLIKTGFHHDHVMGVLYELTSRQMSMLDTFEGAPHLYTRMVVSKYNRKDIFAYVSIEPSYTQQKVRKFQPAIDYVQLMIDGYEQHKLPTEAEFLKKNVLPKATKRFGTLM